MIHLSTSLSRRADGGGRDERRSSGAVYRPVGNLLARRTGGGCVTDIVRQRAVSAKSSSSESPKDEAADESDDKNASDDAYKRNQIRSQSSLATSEEQALKNALGAMMATLETPPESTENASWSAGEMGN